MNHIKPSMSGGNQTCLCWKSHDTTPKFSLASKAGICSHPHSTASFQNGYTEICLIRVAIVTGESMAVIKK